MEIDANDANGANVYYHVFNVVPGAQPEGIESDLPTLAEMQAMTTKASGKPLTHDHIDRQVGTISQMFMLDDAESKEHRLMARVRFDLSNPTEMLASKMAESGYYNSVSLEWWKDDHAFSGLTLTDLPRIAGAWSVSSNIPTEKNKEKNMSSASKLQLNKTAYKSHPTGSLLSASFASMDTPSTTQTNETMDETQPMDVSATTEPLVPEEQQPQGDATEVVSKFNSASDALFNKHPTGHGSVGTAPENTEAMVQVPKRDWQMLNSLGHKQSEQLTKFQAANTEVVDKYEMLSKKAQEQVESEKKKDAKIKALEARLKIETDGKAQKFVEVMQRFKNEAMKAAIDALSPTEAQAYERKYDQTMKDPLSDEAFSRSILVASFAKDKQQATIENELKMDIEKLREQVKQQLPEPRYVNDRINTMFQQQPVQSVQQTQQVQQNRAPLAQPTQNTSAMQADIQQISASVNNMHMNKFDPNGPNVHRVKLTASFANGFATIQQAPIKNQLQEICEFISAEYDVPFYATHFRSMVRRSFQQHEARKYGY